MFLIIHLIELHQPYGDQEVEEVQHFHVHLIQALSYKIDKLIRFVGDEIQLTVSHLSHKYLFDQYKHSHYLDNRLPLKYEVMLIFQNLKVQ